MQSRRMILGALVIVALYLLSVAPHGRSADEATRQPKWEYKVVSSGYDLNELGNTGWELVATTSSLNTTYLYFKRPKN